MRLIKMPFCAASSKARQGYEPWTGCTKPDFHSRFAVVISTLTIAGLFSPLRRRIHLGIDRRFYRQKYDAEQVLAKFGITFREEVDLDHLSKSILTVVKETIQPAHVSIWLRKNAPAKANTYR